MSTSTPTVSGSNRRRSTLITSSLIVAALLIGMAGMNVYNSYSYSQQHEDLGMRGQVTISVDHKVVDVQKDLILGPMYAMLMCKMWNDTTACSQVTGYYSNFSGGCSQQVVNGTTINSPANYYSRGMCSMTAVGLTIVTTAPSNTSPYFCAGGAPDTSNGFSPAHATTSYSASSNSITLTATWTATGPLNGIDAACLYPWNDYTGAAVVPSSPTTTVWTQFTPTSLTTGQSFQLQWLFSF